jgi:hypothetical protein
MFVLNILGLAFQVLRFSRKSSAAGTKDTRSERVLSVVEEGKMAVQWKRSIVILEMDISLQSINFNRGAT